LKTDKNSTSILRGQQHFGDGFFLATEANGSIREFFCAYLRRLVALRLLLYWLHNDETCIVSLGKNSVVYYYSFYLG